MAAPSLWTSMVIYLSSWSKIYPNNWLRSENWQIISGVSRDQVDICHAFSSAVLLVNIPTRVHLPNVCWVAVIAIPWFLHLTTQNLPCRTIFTVHTLHFSAFQTKERYPLDKWKTLSIPLTCGTYTDVKLCLSRDIASIHKWQIFVKYTSRGNKSLLSR